MTTQEKKMNGSTSVPEPNQGGNARAATEPGKRPGQVQHACDPEAKARTCPHRPGGEGGCRPGHAEAGVVWGGPSLPANTLGSDLTPWWLQVRSSSLTIQVHQRPR